jgi:hypothetical protein
MFLPSKKIDLVIAVLIPLLVFLSVFFFDLHITYLESLVLILGLPSVYLSLKNQKIVKKVFWFSLVISVPVAIILELVGFGDNAWSVPSSVLPWKLFGIIPLEDFLWMFLTVYTIIIFYEHFCNRRFQSKVSSKIWVINSVLYLLAVLAVFVFMTNADLLVLPYTYIWLSIPMFLIPSILFLGFYPRFLIPFLKVQIYFFFAHSLFELIGIKLGHWTFPGMHYLGWISVWSLRFPVEELAFVMLLGAFATLSYYEFFTNNPDPSGSRLKSITQSNATEEIASNNQ